MLTEFVRDQAFAIGWFGLMAFVWLGWAQEDPPKGARWVLGLGSLAGVAFAGVYLPQVFVNWDTASALDGRYHWYGLVVAAEVLVAAIGAVQLVRRDRTRWVAWWVAMVVAIHFLTLAPLLDDPALAVLGVIQAIGLVGLLIRLRGVDGVTSRLVGPWMGATFLAFAALSVVVGPG